VQSGSRAGLAGCASPREHALVNPATQPIGGWPPWLVKAVRAVKNSEALFSQHTLCGVPLDWPLRFIVLGGLYLILQRRLRRRRAAAICTAILLLKETLDCFAVLKPWCPRPPDLGDLADVASGLLGLVCAERGRRIYRLRGHASRPR
jgi:hypothetical protein